MRNSVQESVRDQISVNPDHDPAEIRIFFTELFYQILK